MTKARELKISLLITLYKGSDPDWLEECLESVYPQRKYLYEVVLVYDGEISTRLKMKIVEWDEKWQLRKIYLSRNYGPGGASQYGMQECRGDWIARLDADDIASPARFYHQTKFLQEHPEVDVLGGYMPEFKGEKEQTFAVNYVPQEHKQISRMVQLRSPMVNSSSVFRRDRALAAGGYEFLHSHEDHLLWMALLKQGAIFANLPKLMGYYRASPEYYKRRRGIGVIRTELNFQGIARRRGYISLWQYYRNIFLRIPPRFLPAFLLKIFYNIFLRSRIRYGDL